jgi:hypothetical protein
MTGRLPCAAKAWISASALIVVASSWGPKLGNDVMSMFRRASYRSSSIIIARAISFRRFSGDESPPDIGIRLKEERSLENAVATLTGRKVCDPATSSNTRSWWPLLTNKSFKCRSSRAVASIPDPRVVPDGRKGFSLPYPFHWRQPDVVEPDVVAYDAETRAKHTSRAPPTSARSASRRVAIAAIQAHPRRRRRVTVWGGGDAVIRRRDTIDFSVRKQRVSPPRVALHTETHDDAVRRARVFVRGSVAVPEVGADFHPGSVRFYVSGSPKRETPRPTFRGHRRSRWRICRVEHHDPVFVGLAQTKHAVGSGRGKRDAW